MRTKRELVKALSAALGRFFVMERVLKYTAQGQEIFGGSLLPGLFLLIVFAVGVVVALVLLALT